MSLSTKKWFIDQPTQSGKSLIKKSSIKQKYIRKLYFWFKILNVSTHTKVITAMICCLEQKSEMNQERMKSI